jgi:hypothetical protein
MRLLFMEKRLAIGLCRFDPVGLEIARRNGHFFAQTDVRCWRPELVSTTGTVFRADFRRA